MDNIVIENTTLCGADCIMCPRGGYNHPLQIMEFDVFKKTVDESARLGVKTIIFGGFGDPLMDRDLEQRFKYIKTTYPSIKISTSTTGQLMNNRVLDLICLYVDFIKISNYGFTKKSYEAVHRGSLKYEEIKEKIDNLLKRKKKPEVCLSFLLLPENEQDMKNWQDYYEAKADRIDIWKPHNWTGDYQTQENAEDTTEIPCHRVLKLDNITVRADGSVTICCFDYNRNLIIGDIKEKSLKDIINSERVKSIQKVHADKNVCKSLLLCKSCDQIRNREDCLIYTSGNMQVNHSSLVKD